MKRFGWLIVAVALLAAIAPQTTQGQAIISIEIATYGNVDAAKQAEYQNALEKAALYYRQEFGELPLSTVKLVIFENSDYAAKGLVTILNYPEDRARAYAESFSAFAIGRTSPMSIFVNAEKKRNIPFQMAHEFMHLLQYRWSGGAIDSASAARFQAWIIEGMADFYGGKTINAIENMRRNRIKRVRDKWEELSTLSLFDLDWLAVNQRVGATIYSYTFLSYEFLEQKTSRQAVLAYFRELQLGYPPHIAFRKAFNMEPAAFEAELKTYIPTLFQ